jgi:hypothetical protein
MRYTHWLIFTILGSEQKQWEVKSKLRINKLNK